MLPGKDSASRFLSILVIVAVIINGLGLFLPVFLFFLTDDFTGKLFFTSCFLLIGIERFWFSLFTSKEKNPCHCQTGLDVSRCGSDLFRS